MSSMRGFIDSDVHPLVKGEYLASLRPYLTEGWHKHFESKSGGAWGGGFRLPYPRYKLPFSNFARDTFAPDGGLPCSDPVTTAKSFLDPYELTAAILIPLEHAFASSFPSADETIALAGAMNDYFIAEWLGRDSRYKLAIGVSPKDPQAAADEIRRLEGTRGVVGVYLPLTDCLLGNRYFYPIYQAAQDAGLSIMLHIAAGEGDFRGQAALPGGQPSFFSERSVTFSTLAQSNIVSLIFEGVPERFPSLKFVFVEFGFSYAPHVMWRMDDRWRALRNETPWVKRPPSEYVFENIRFTSQPIDEPPVPRYLLEMLDMIDAERTLLFSTDYPHWDTEYPGRVLAPLPADLRRRLLIDNALETYPRLGPELNGDLPSDEVLIRADVGSD
jgi:predicted TIM-barrel fold metal-dependent hydrolase